LARGSERLLIIASLVFVVVATALAVPIYASQEGSQITGEAALISPLARTRGVDPLAPAPGYDDASEYFAGSVGVAVFLAESTGPAYDWSDAEVTESLDGIYAGMSWWASQEPRARLTFAYELYVREPTTSEPIQNSLNDDYLWIHEILGNLGYTEADPWSRALHLNNDVRARLGTDWAYSMFVADSNDAVNQGLFTNNQYAHGYYGGPWLTMSRYSSWAFNSPDYFRVVPAHETGHIFYATDEYDSVPMSAGYLNCPDNDGAAGIMNTNILLVSASTRCQLGWRDSDGDGVLDVLDVPPDTSLTPYLPDPTTDRQLAYDGSSTVVALPNQNPFGPGNAVTISRLSGVDVRVDGGAWSSAAADDGAFDEPIDGFSFVTTPLGSGTHTVEARARNTEGNADGTPASDSVEILLNEIAYTVPTDYDTFVQWWQDLETQYPGYLQMLSPNQAYGLGQVPSSTAHLPYDLWMVRLTNESVAGPKPEAFFMGNPHGDERAGPIGAYWFVDWILRHATNDSWNTPYDDWLNWLLDHREVYFLVSHNPDGFDRIRRCDALNIDLNREADHDGPEGAGSCPVGAPAVFSTVQGQTVARFMEEHQIRAGMDFHGGIRALLYPWGSTRGAVTAVSPVTSFTWEYAPPDFAFFDVFSHRMGDYMLDFDYIGNTRLAGNFGPLNVGTPPGIVNYEAAGTYLAWGYGANTVAAPAEAPFVDNGPYLGSGALWITPELSTNKNPPQAHYGGDITEGFGIDVRNMLLSMIDIAQPYARWHPSGASDGVTVEAGGYANLAWQVNGSLVVDDTYVVWGTDPDPVGNPQGSSPHQTTYAGQYFGGTGWEGANKGTTTGFVWRESWRAPSTPGTYYVVARGKVDQRYAQVLRPDVYGSDSYLRIVKERTMPGWSEDILGADGLEHMEYTEWWDSEVLRIEVVPDATPPVITLRSPADGAIVRAGTRIDFHVTDGNPTTSTASVDGGPATPLPAPWDLSTNGWTDGTHAVTVTATDSGGHGSQRTASFVFDSTLPAITLVNPAAGSILAVGSSIDLSVVDAHLVSTSWSINGSASTLAAPFDVSTAGWAEGPVMLSITAADVPGNTATASFDFTIDVGPPMLVLVSPSANSVIRGGTALDFEVVDVSATTATWDAGAGAQILVAPFDIDTTGWPDGPVTVAIEATDAFGRRTVASFPFILDSTAPAITLVTPPSGAVVRPGTIVDLAVSDANLVAVFWDAGSGEAQFPAPYDRDTSFFLDGTYAITVRAVDAAGNEGLLAFPLTIDGTPPVVTRTDSGTLVQPGHLVELTVSDASGVTATYDLGGGPLPLAPPFALDTTTWADGDYAITIAAVDAAGNEATLETAVTIDGTAPAVTASAPDRILLRPGSRTILFTATDLHGPTITAAWRDGLPMTLRPPWTAQLEVDIAGPLGWTDGEHYILVRAADLAGNEEDFYLWVITDATPPEVGAPAAQDVPVGTAVGVNVSIEDAHGPVDVALQWRFAGGGWETLSMNSAGGSAWTATIPAQSAPGIIEMFVVALDEVGNQAQSATVSVQVLAGPPADAGVSPVLIVAIVFAVAVPIVALFFLRRKKKESA